MDTHAHEPHRPTWRCATCGADWPCPSRRRLLVEALRPGRVALALHLAPYFEQALRDRPHDSATALYHRFLSWVRCRER